jgi:acyl dehydratase
MVEPLRYETIPVGQVVGPFAYVVPHDFNQRRLAAFSGRNLSDCFAGEHGEFAEPSFLYGQHSWVMRKHFSWAGSVHAKCDVGLEAPVRPGARIHVTGRIADKYERRGGRYAVFEMTTVDDDDRLICIVRNSMLLNFREVVTRRRETEADPPMASISLPKDKAVDPGLAVSFGPKLLARDDILKFYTAEEQVYGPHASLHNDEAAAKAAGLADIIAPGRYSLGLVSCLLGGLHRGRWLPGARFSVVFLRNLLPGVVLRANAIATERSSVLGPPGGTIDLTCVDERSGLPVLSGTAQLPGEGENVGTENPFDVGEPGL